MPSLRRRGQLDAGADLLGQGVGGRAQVVGDQALGEALRDDVRDLLADELVALVAELLLGLEVEQDDLAGLVDDDHGVGRGLEQAAVARVRTIAITKRESDAVAVICLRRSPRSGSVRSASSFDAALPRTIGHYASS